MGYIRQEEAVAIYPVRDVQLPDSCKEAGNKNGMAREVLAKRTSSGELRLPTTVIDTGANRHLTAYEMANQMNDIFDFEIRPDTVKKEETKRGPYVNRTHRTRHIYLCAVLDSKKACNGNFEWIPKKRLSEFLTFHRSMVNDITRAMNHGLPRGEIKQKKSESEKERIERKLKREKNTSSEEDEEGYTDPREVSSNHKTFDQF